jgi:hypothetical protein
MKKTGYDIELRIKPFVSSSALPENLEYNEDDDLIALIDKYEVGLNDYSETFTTDINYRLSSAGSNASIYKITEIFLKDTIVDDESKNSWFCSYFKMLS